MTSHNTIAFASQLSCYCYSVATLLSAITTQLVSTLRSLPLLVLNLSVEAVTIMESPVQHLLFCFILINRQLKILHNAFPLRIQGPLREPQDFCPFLRSVIPSLRDKNNTSFSFYEPLVTISYHQSDSLNETQVDLRTPVRMQRLDSLKTDLEKEAFDSIDIIICVDDTTPIVLFPHQVRHGPQYLTLIELQGSVIQRPRPESLASNHIYDALECNPLTPVPDFVKNFDTMLRAKRIPVPGITPDYPQFVRDVLGDDVYNSYFDAPSKPMTLETPLFEPIVFTRSAGFSEFMHYHQILSDPQLTCSAVFRASKEHHGYSLLRHLSSRLEDSGKINL
ncbi:hypothetical protein BJY52DRAFT_1196043 [Lactarius psammicola]|nr:hypothetical protein BJY52DRAFT_1196043 [Lactarius psammicola]